VTAQKFKNYLVENGASTLGVNSPHEAWRLKLADANFTYYHKGTLYSTPSNANDFSVAKAWEHFDTTLGSAYTSSTQKYLIGLDETGKGEVLGPLVLAGALLPLPIHAELDRLIGPADTKNKHTFQYWEKLFRQMEGFRGVGFNFIIEQIPPEDLDQYNLNRLLDVVYQKIIIRLLRQLPVSECRIVVDDYGVGPNFSRFLNLLKSRGAEIVVATQSEDSYLETKAASLIAKHGREVVMQALEESEAFQLAGASLGSGNSGDVKTRDWLQRWRATGKAWPWFVKKSFSTVRKLDSLPEKTIKKNPPIETELLGVEFMQSFLNGKPSLEALRVHCPACGRHVQRLNLVLGQQKKTELLCPAAGCGRPILNAAMNLKYYCGALLPDCSAIQRETISQELRGAALLENFNILWVPVVRVECEKTPQGAQALHRLRQLHKTGRIRLETVGLVADVPQNLSDSERDERIINSCLEHNAILLTANQALAAFAVGKNVFTILEG
jgi:ribonuclease HII